MENLEIIIDTERRKILIRQCCLCDKVKHKDGEHKPYNIILLQEQLKKSDQNLVVSHGYCKPCYAVYCREYLKVDPEEMLNE
jgi:hypothetical protein